MLAQHGTAILIGVVAAAVLVFMGKR